MKRMLFLGTKADLEKAIANSNLQELSTEEQIKVVGGVYQNDKEK